MSGQEEARGKVKRTNTTGSTWTCIRFIGGGHAMWSMCGYMAAIQLDLIDMFKL